MVHPAPQVALRPATAAEILPFVAAAGPHASAQEHDRIAAGGSGFIVVEDGEPVFGYVVRESGGELLVTAAAGNSRRDLTGAGLALIEAQARGLYSAIRFYTLRPGLVRKAARHGYETAGRDGNTFIMRKKIKCDLATTSKN